MQDYNTDKVIMWLLQSVLKHTSVFWKVACREIPMNASCCYFLMESKTNGMNSSIFKVCTFTEVPFGPVEGTVRLSIDLML